MQFQGQIPRENCQKPLNGFRNNIMTRNRVILSSMSSLGITLWKEEHLRQCMRWFSVTHFQKRKSTTKRAGPCLWWTLSKKMDTLLAITSTSVELFNFTPEIPNTRRYMLSLGITREWQWIVIPTTKTQRPHTVLYRDHLRCGGDVFMGRMPTIMGWNMGHNSGRGIKMRRRPSSYSFRMGMMEQVKLSGISMMCWLILSGILTKKGTSRTRRSSCYQIMGFICIIFISWQHQINTHMNDLYPWCI